MPRIAHCRARHNTRRRLISYNSRHHCPTPETAANAPHRGTPKVTAVPPETGALADSPCLPVGCIELYRLIARAAAPGQNAVRLRQIDLAAQLQVSAVTIRRRTRCLEQAGLLQARRVNNAIRYSIACPRTEAARPERKAFPSAPVPTATATAPIPATPPTTPAPLEPPTPSAGAANTTNPPKCPYHHASRVSYMTDAVSHPVHHCTGFIAGNRCSWLHVQGYGTVRPPGLPEWQLTDLLQHLSPPPAESPTRPSVPQPATKDDNAPRTPAQHLWAACLRIMAEDMQDHDVASYLREPIATQFVNDVLTVAVPHEQDQTWLSKPMNQEIATEAISQLLNRPAQVQYVIK